MDVTYKSKTIALVIFMALGEVLSTTSLALAESSDHFLTATPIFAGIPWNTDAESVKSQMIEKGYKFDADGSAKDPDHDLSFTGSVQNIDSQIFEIFDKNRHLVGTNIRILTSDEFCKSTFDSVISWITQKYGDPSSQTESFQRPFTGAPSDFIPAIKQNKANFDIIWKKTGDDPPEIEARVDDNLTVLIFYNSQQWWAENRRRLSKPDPNL